MGNRLVRVMKQVKTSRGSHRQAFNVKQASPGDVYAQTSRPDNTPRVQSAGYSGGQDPSQEVPQEEPVQDPPPRLEVEPLLIPWGLGSSDMEGESDPISPELRKRFDPDDKSTRIRQPMNVNVPLFSVSPGEDLLWGGNETELLNRLRSGIVTGVKISNSACLNMLGKIEANDGTIERAYLRFEAVAEKDIYELYGDMYGLKHDGDLSKRAAAAYELAKAAGLDDLIPPTVYRFDEHDGLEPVLSLTALDDLADQLGQKTDELHAKLGSHVAVEMWTPDTSLLVLDDWYRRLVSDDAVSLNDFYRESPYRESLLRGAIFDYLAWTGQRSLTDLVCCSNKRHPLHLLRNDLIFPDPIAMGTAFIDYGGTYTDGPSATQYAPMLWSDLVSQAAIRGFDEEVAVYDRIADECTRRMRGGVMLDLIRSLNDHGISQLAIAALLVRVSFLRSGAAVVMRNPLIVAAYFSSLITGEAFDPGFHIDIEGMQASIDTALSKALTIDFDFVAEMQGRSND